MVGGGAHGADTVESGGETGNGGFEVAITITIVIDALEEFEDSWVWRVGGVQRLDFLHGDVGVANDFPILERLRSGIVGNSGVWSCESVFTVRN